MTHRVGSRGKSGGLSGSKGIKVKETREQGNCSMTLGS